MNMGKRLINIGLLFLLFIYLSKYKVSSQTDSVNVLFIGNSITYVNNMPVMFRDIANNKGKNVSVSMYAPGGTGIVNHFVDNNVFALLRNKTWDIVVIQPGTSESQGTSYPVDTTVKRGRVILDSIYNYSPCAKVYLYEIPYGVPSTSTYSTYFSVQTIIRDSVLKMADSLKLQMLPAGECARAYYSMYQNLLLHNSYNDIHPCAYGSFLIASAFYTGIFQDTVSGCTFYSSIPQDSATEFFSIADTVVLNHLSLWRINNYNLHSDFSYSTGGNTVSFSCQSSNYSNVLWDFGDNSSSTVANPSHTYLSTGSYNVKLYSYNGNCIDSAFRQINIITTGEVKISDNEYKIGVFPNPAGSHFYLKTAGNSEKLSYRIFDFTGVILQTGIINNSEQEIVIFSFPSGFYILELMGNGKIIGYKKFIKSED
jgi:hypothetical protein